MVESGIEEKTDLSSSKIFLVNIIGYWMKRITEFLVVLMKSSQNLALKN